MFYWWLVCNKWRKFTWKTFPKYLLWRTRVRGKEISTKLYDKRDSFIFEIVCVFFFNSNITSNIFYSSTGFETLRLARNANDCVKFMLVKKLLGRMSKEESQKIDIMIILNKIFCYNIELFNKSAEVSVWKNSPSATKIKVG